MKTKTTRYFMDTEFVDDGKTIDLISIGIVAEDGRELYLESADFDKGKANQWVRENVLPRLKGGECRWPLRSIKVMLLDFFDREEYGKPELWGYYSAYDHVAFCQLFGTMSDLPKGFPMYTRDLKQWCDSLGNPRLPEQGKGEHNALQDARWNREAYHFLQDYSRKLWDPESLASRFHEAYERLAPSYGYTTREQSAVPWERVPEQNRQLMIAVAGEILSLAPGREA